MVRDELEETADMPYTPAREDSMLSATRVAFEKPLSTAVLLRSSKARLEKKTASEKIVPTRR